MIVFFIILPRSDWNIKTYSLQAWNPCGWIGGNNTSQGWKNMKIGKQINIKFRPLLSLNPHRTTKMPEKVFLSMRPVLKHDEKKGHLSHHCETLWRQLGGKGKGKKGSFLTPLWGTLKAIRRKRQSTFFVGNFISSIFITTHLRSRPLMTSFSPKTGFCSVNP